METVQLIINDGSYALALRDLLERSGSRRICSVAVPDPKQEGVIVVDSDALDRLPLPILNPERVVLITRNDPQHLAQAWNAGIRSVVFNEDPLSTAVLAIMAAELRVPKSEPRWGVSHAPHAIPVQGIAPASAQPLKHGAAPLTTVETNVHHSKSRERSG